MRDDATAVLASLVPEHLARAAWSAGQVEAHRREALRATLREAIEGSPFWKRRLRGIDPASFRLEDLPSLPVLTKDQMMEGFDDLVADRRVTRAACERHLDQVGDEPTLLHGEYLVLASGGSSGVRGLFVFGVRAAAEYTLGGVRASLARQMRQAPPSAGGRRCTAMLAAASAVHATRALPALFSGLLDAASIPATLPLAEITRRLQALQPSALHGYPTVIARVADEQAAGRLAIAPTAITTSSEPLTVELRARIEGAFGVGVVDQFGCSEGIMGAGEPGSPAIALPGDLVILEFVDDGGLPVAAGREAGRVLVTTLYNPVQPLIRYELTDRMTLLEGPFADGHPRVTVHGRSDDLLRYGQVVVHPHAIRSVMVRTPAVREYQVRQAGDGVDLLVVPVAGIPLDAAELGARIRTALQEAGLAEPRVSVRVVDGAFPRDERTGKVLRVVPLV